MVRARLGCRGRQGAGPSRGKVTRSTASPASTRLEGASCRSAR